MERTRRFSQTYTKWLGKIKGIFPVRRTKTCNDRFKVLVNLKACNFLIRVSKNFSYFPIICLRRYFGEDSQEEEMWRRSLP